MEELGTADLTTEQIETLCEAAENAARKYVLSKIPSKTLEKLDISVEAEGTKPLKITVELDLVLSPKMNEVDANKLLTAAVKEAFKASEKYLRKIE